MEFKLEKEDASSKARAGVITTDHGTIKTPIFMPVGYEITFAEMDAELKNSMSHRGRAVRELLDFLMTL